jgi:hypothetical protein
MAAEPGSSTRVSGTRLALLVLVLLAGLVLFFAYARRTPVMIHPDVEAVP